MCPLNKKIENGRLFNASSTVHVRTSQNLKLPWENLKKMAKRVAVQNKAEIFKTGGGLPKKLKVNPIVDKICTMIKTQVEGLVNPFDSNELLGQELIKKALHGPNTSSMASDNVEDDNVQNTGDKNDLTEHESSVSITPLLNRSWANHTVHNLRGPLHEALVPEERSSAAAEHSVQSKYYSRRRPKLPDGRQKFYDNLLKCKTEALEESRKQAHDELSMKKEMFQVELELKKEQMKQEKLKTRLLEKEVIEKNA